MHKAGFVNIVGLPNVGKSTLMNALVGERLSIISPKAQTTRHRIIGIVNEPGYQIVFSDTPGYVNEPGYALHRTMNTYVHQSFEDADVLFLITDKYQKIEEQAFLISQLSQTKVAVVVVFNKLDLCREGELEEWQVRWKQELPMANFVPISAKDGTNIDKLIEFVVRNLPESEAYYDKDSLTDRHIRYFVSEIVREKIFLNYQKEIPYSCQVVCEEYKEADDMDRIRCTIFVERESQKNIVIGKGGSSLNKVGTEARLAIEEFVGKKVFLGLFVKVKPNWRNNDQTLRSFGFEKTSD
ncbi:MAG: GTPase Era [Bacteroidetes bacterium]|nr:GTPase Era [Bacteroidota bacterium]